MRLNAFFVRVTLFAALSGAPPVSTLAEEPKELEDRQEKDIEIAETWMSEYLASRDFPTQSHSFLARGVLWEANPLAEGSADLIFGFAKTRRGAHKDRLRIYGVKGDATSSRYWENQIWSDNEVFIYHHVGELVLRPGHQQGSLISTLNHPAGANPIERVTAMQTVPHVDAYFLPLYEFGSLIVVGKQAHQNYGVKWFLLNSEVVAAKRDKSDQLVGTWRIGGSSGSLTDVTFGEDSHRPIRTVWRRVLPGRQSIEDKNQLPVFSVAVTTWKRQLAGDEKVWVPEKVRIAAVDVESGVPDREASLFIRWKFGEQATYEFPPVAELQQTQTTGLDWREQLRKSYDENWRLSYEDFSARREDADRKRVKGN